MSTPGILVEAASLVEAALDECLPSEDRPPVRLHQAMRYAVQGGGKRLRPALVLAACRAAGGTPAACRAAMAAVELFHTYTLVHDDLPAMDDDDLRRGRPACHKAFGEATAILAGDALLTLSLELLAGMGAEAVRCLACAGGSLGVVGGQQEDLDAEGQPFLPGNPADQERLERIHRLKTAALLRASCELGALAAGAAPALRDRLVAFGEALGLAFQIVDDILDATVDAERLGKTPGKDRVAGKLTWVALNGLEQSVAAAARLRAEALDALSAFGPVADDLRGLAGFVLDRRR